MPAQVGGVSIQLASLELVEVERVALVQAEIVGGVEVDGVVGGVGYLDRLLLLVGAAEVLPGVGYLECLLFICLDSFSLAWTMNCVVLTLCWSCWTARLCSWSLGWKDRTECSVR